MRIALDAMGGDHAPASVVAGAVEAAREYAEVSLVLFGDEARIRSELECLGNCARITVVPTTQVIDMDESPVDALRRKRDSSMVRMVEAAAQGEVDAIISAGNTGAYAAACQLRMRTLPGVNRAGIAVTIPAFNGPFVLLDVGANIQPKARHLYEYALMGQAYARHVASLPRQRVGLLNVGEENVKGTEIVQLANEMITADGRLEFVGNIEGRDLFDGVCEVAVSDGFVGNVMLKLFEGFSRGILDTVKKEVAEEKPELKPHFDDVVARIWKRHDYTEFGGAPLLGVKGVAMICHGSSDAHAMKHAVRTTIKYLSAGLNEILTQRVGAAE